MRNNIWLVLKLQLILGSLTFIFSKNDIRASAHVFFVRTLETYIHFYLCLTCVVIVSYVKLIIFPKHFVMWPECWKVVNWILFSFFCSFFLVGVICIDMLNVFYRIGSVHKTQTRFSLFLKIINSLCFVTILYWNECSPFEKYIYDILLFP